jgi:hypothetical protein
VVLVLGRLGCGLGFVGGAPVVLLILWIRHRRWAFNDVIWRSSRVSGFVGGKAVLSRCDVAGLLVVSHVVERENALT